MAGWRYGEVCLCDGCDIQIILMSDNFIHWQLCLWVFTSTAGLNKVERMATKDLITFQNNVCFYTQTWFRWLKNLMLIQKVHTIYLLYYYLVLFGSLIGCEGHFSSPWELCSSTLFSLISVAIMTKSFINNTKHAFLIC